MSVECHVSLSSHMLKECVDVEFIIQVVVAQVKHLSARNDCQHLPTAINIEQVKKALKTNRNIFTCIDCSVENDEKEMPEEVWLCLQCGHTGCSRFSENKHAFQHYHNSFEFETLSYNKHSVVFDTLTGCVWCYECQNFVNVSSLILKECVEFIMKVVRSSKALPSLETLSQNFEGLCLDEHFSDIILKVRGHEFKAHKSVLCSRSPVFFAMFHHEMTEKNTGVVEINDMDPDFFQNFLLYIYSGKCDCVTAKNAVVLYKAADKYDIQSLKKECVFKMEASLSVEIILDVILTADNYEEKELLDSATEFFIQNAETIYKMDEFDNFFITNSKLAKELMRKALIKE